VVVAARAAHVGNAPLTQGSTVFSGDLLKTADKGAIQIEAKQVKLAAGENSSMRIFRQGERTVIELEYGVITYSARAPERASRFYAQDVKFSCGHVQTGGRPDFGEIAVRVDRYGRPARWKRRRPRYENYRGIEIIKLTSAIGVDYQDSWQPVPEISRISS